MNLAKFKVVEDMADALPENLEGKERKPKNAVNRPENGVFLTIPACGPRG
jgi:hypothetical protein